VKPLSEQRFQSLLALLAPPEMDALKVRTPDSAYFMKLNFNHVANGCVSDVTMRRTLAMHSTHTGCTLLCILALTCTVTMHSRELNLGLRS
jgi:hypothetical protein